LLTPSGEAVLLGEDGDEEPLPQAVNNVASAEPAAT
jgi:hypothetical protein